MKNTKETIMNVVIERLEGLHEECITVKVKSLKAANKVLKNMAKTAPEGGGYDKTNFVITFRDGDTYSGRIDLVHISQEKPDLVAHIKNHLLVHAGLKKPEHLTSKDYEGYLDMFGKELRDECKEFMASYEIA